PVAVSEGFIVGEDIVGEGQGAAHVQDAAAAGAGSQPVFNRQAGNGDGDRLLVLADIKDPAGLVAADGQQAGARSFNIHALAYGQLAAGQRDGLAVQAGSEDDGVAILGLADEVAQRPGTLVQGVGDRQGAENRAVFEYFEPWHERPPAVGRIANPADS